MPDKQATAHFKRVIAMEDEKLWDLVATLFQAVIDRNIKKGLQAGQKLEEANITDSEAWYYWAAHYGLLADTDGCVRCLRRAVDGGFFNYPFMISDPFLDSVRADPEIQKILEEAKEKHLAFKKKFFPDKT